MVRRGRKLKKFGHRGAKIQENHNLEGSWKLSERLYPNQDPFLVAMSTQVEGEMVEDEVKFTPSCVQDGP